MQWNIVSVVTRKKDLVVIKFTALLHNSLIHISLIGSTSRMYGIKPSSVKTFMAVPRTLAAGKWTRESEIKAKQRNITKPGIYVYCDLKSVHNNNTSSNDSLWQNYDFLHCWLVFKKYLIIASAMQDFFETKTYEYSVFCCSLTFLKKHFVGFSKEYIYIK